MSALATSPNCASPTTELRGAATKIALLGSGTVGLAVLDRLSQWRGTPLGQNLKLVYAANTRHCMSDPEGLDFSKCGEVLSTAPRSFRRTDPSEVISALGSTGVRILIDATADAEVAVNHPTLL